MVDLKGKAVFLSGPMSGRSFYNVAEFAEAHAKLKAAGVHRIYDPAIEYLKSGVFDAVKPHDYWMGRCIRELVKPISITTASDHYGECYYTVLVSLPGWEESEGARRELEVALARAGTAAKASEATPANLDDAYIDAALADFKEYYSAHIDVCTRPYTGMPELLTELAAAGVKMAVVSNKFQEGTELLVREFFTDIDFVAILGNRPGWPLKPSPEIVEDVLRRSGVSRAEAILVGDSPTDMRTAANGGIDAIAVGWGYRSPEEIAESCTVRPPIALSVPDLHRLLFQSRS